MANQKTPGLIGPDGKPLSSRKLSASSYGYDLLQRRHDSDNWQNAVRANDVSINDRERLQALRDLARGEKRNNPHMQGVIHKIVNETIGTGPRLSIEPLTISDRSMRAAERVEKLWEQYNARCCFSELLRLMVEERITAGETFAVVQANRTLPVPIEVRVFEGEQIQSGEYFYEDFDPFTSRRANRNDGRVDGINFDAAGNVASYSLLKCHPYGTRYNYIDMDRRKYKTVDADLVWHWFRKDRPSQYRGVPEVAPMLEIYSRLRRFVESKVIQEELRAKVMGALKTSFAPDSGCMDLGDSPIDMLIGDGQFTSLPDGWELQLFNLDVTGEGVQAFVRTMLSWATQALLVPWNIVAGDSSDYNFASGRLDHALFYNYVKIQRQQIQKHFLDWFINEHWFPMARLAKELPGDLGLFKTVWYWDRREPIDENKQANADKTLLEAGLLDETAYWADRGINAHEAAERQIRFVLMKEKMKEEIAAEMGVKLHKPPSPSSDRPEDPNIEGNNDEPSEASQG